MKISEESWYLKRLFEQVSAGHSNDKIQVTNLTRRSQQWTFYLFLFARLKTKDLTRIGCKIRNLKVDSKQSKVYLNENGVKFD